MNEKHLHNLIDEALLIQQQGGDLEAFYKNHENYRAEIASLIASGNMVRSLTHTTAPEMLRSHVSAITAHDQIRISSWDALFAPHILFRAAALAVFVILLGGGFAYQQNVTRKQTLASFDAIAVDHQNFLNTVGQEPIVATLSVERTNNVLVSPTPKTLAPNPVVTPSSTTPPPIANTTDTTPVVSLGALYDAQAALDVLQNDLNTLP